VSIHAKNKWGKKHDVKRRIAGKLFGLFVSCCWLSFRPSFSFECMNESFYWTCFFRFVLLAHLIFGPPWVRMRGQTQEEDDKQRPLLVKYNLCLFMYRRTFHLSLYLGCVNEHEKGGKRGEGGGPLRKRETTYHPLHAHTQKKHAFISYYPFLPSGVSSYIHPSRHLRRYPTLPLSPFIQACIYSLLALFLSTTTAWQLLLFPSLSCPLPFHMHTPSLASSFAH